MEKPKEADTPGALVHSPPRPLYHCRTSTGGKVFSLVFYSTAGAIMAHSCLTSALTWPLTAALLVVLALVYWTERRP